MVVLEDIPVIDVPDARLGVHAEGIDPLELRTQPLSGLYHRRSACGFVPKHPLPTDNGPLDERRREGDDVGYELVERLAPAALLELVLDLVLHPVRAVLRFLQ